MSPAELRLPLPRHLRHMERRRPLNPACSARLDQHVRTTGRQLDCDRRSGQQAGTGATSDVVGAGISEGASGMVTIAHRLKCLYNCEV